MICKTKGCKNKAVQYRKFCHKCRSRQYKERHPLRYWFNVLRNNARRRGKRFDLSFDQFKDFCMKTGYIQLKGKCANALSIDRIDPTQGYSIENIRAITLSENAYRNNTKKKKKNIRSIEEDCPF